MTKLDNGIVIDESLNAQNYTALADVPAVFGYNGTKVGVTVHHWGSDGQNIHDVARYLAGNNDRQNSAHFVLQADKVYCIVNSFDSSWHSGHPLGNAQTIGIECRPEMTAGDIETLASLIRFLESHYGDLLVYKHSDWQATACPGRYGAQMNNIIAKVNAGKPAGKPVAKPAPPAAKPPVKAPAAKTDCCCHD